MTQPQRLFKTPQSNSLTLQITKLIKNFLLNFPSKYSHFTLQTFISFDVFIHPKTNNPRIDGILNYNW